MPGTGADITKQDAESLLNRLISERIKVQAAFIGRGSVTAGLIGYVVVGPDNLIWIREGRGGIEPFLRFDPNQATTFKYGDSRVFPDTPNPAMTSALMFIYPDNTQVALFETEAKSA